MQRDGSLQEIIEWDKWRLTNKNTPQNRLILAMRIAGRRFHYTHELDRLVQFTRGQGIRIKVIQREFRKCQMAHENRETESQESYRENRESQENYAIHGWLDLDKD